MLHYCVARNSQATFSARFFVRGLHTIPVHQATTNRTFVRSRKGISQIRGPFYVSRKFSIVGRYFYDVICYQKFQVLTALE
jgi:hypothetical protein